MCTLRRSTNLKYFGVNSYQQRSCSNGPEELNELGSVNKTYTVSFAVSFPPEWWLSGVARALHKQSDLLGSDPGPATDWLTE
jgi:hypothetical protein